MSQRTATVERVTRETDIALRLSLDGDGKGEISTGIGFLDHMLAQLSRHGRLDLSLRCRGDLHIDDHHTAEDCALALGQALDQSLGERRVVVDLSGRPWTEVHLPLSRDAIGGIACENLVHFLRSFAIAARMTLHVDLVRGENDHHKIEAAFKALALALRQAVSLDGEGVPSTKGVL
jgi:imidazoleglycerol phosphate dehydratase HisB